MDKKSKAKAILERLNLISPPPGDDGFKAFDEGIVRLKASLNQDVRAKSLDEVNATLGKFRKEIDLKPLQDAVGSLKSEIGDRFSAFWDVLSEHASDSGANHDAFSKTIEDARKQLEEIISQGKSESAQEFAGIRLSLTQGEGEKKVYQDSVTTRFSDIDKALGEIRDAALADRSEDSASLSSEVDKLYAALDQARADIFSRIATLPHGGNANRNISIGGNSSVLSRYTDMNFKAGANVTLTYVNNDQTKNVDITIAATGGSGGITRSITSVSINTPAGSTAGTDYVYLVSGTTTITLPTAVGNTNLYTIKNVGTGTVTIATTSAQTIDGSTTITLPVQYTSVDIESDGANWNIT